jgi:hypothetical protein
LEKQGRAANQLAAAKHKAVETMAKLQAFCGASESAQLTLPCHNPDKPSDRTSLPGNPASALDNILAARGLLSPVSIPKATTMSNVGQVESTSAQHSFPLQGPDTPSDGTTESANPSPVPASTPAV